MTFHLLVYVLVCVVCLLAGYGIGIISNGIKIYHLDKMPGQQEEDYNQSLVNELPEEQRVYFDAHKGRYDF